MNKRRLAADDAAVDYAMFGGSYHSQDDEAKARSEANILSWMEYLPQDCIETMIRLGWDLTV